MGWKDEEEGRNDVIIFVCLFFSGQGFSVAFAAMKLTMQEVALKLRSTCHLPPASASYVIGLKAFGCASAATVTTTTAQNKFKISISQSRVSWSSMLILCCSTGKLFNYGWINKYQIVFLQSEAKFLKGPNDQQYQSLIKQLESRQNSPKNSC